jgi:hypothetical protein
MSQETNVPESNTALTGIGNLRPGTLELVVAPGISAKDVHKVIDATLEVHGCLACGLNGLDLRIRTQDPVLLEKFRDIEGVKDVNIYR